MATSATTFSICARSYCRCGLFIVFSLVFSWVSPLWRWALVLVLVSLEFFVHFADQVGELFSREGEEVLSSIG